MSGMTMIRRALCWIGRHPDSRVLGGVWTLDAEHGTPPELMEVCTRCHRVIDYSVLWETDARGREEGR